MTRDRVDGLGERVRELRETIECLEAKHTRVRSHVRTLEAVVDVSATPDRHATASTVLDESVSRRSARSEATDEEVAAAVRAVEEDHEAERDTDPLVP